MKLLQELFALCEEEKQRYDWKELFRQAADVTGNTGSGDEKSYRHKMYQDADYQLWYFTMDDPEVETFVAFYQGKAYFLGDTKTVVIDWVEHTISEGEWRDLWDKHGSLFDNGSPGEMFLGLYDNDGEESDEIKKRLDAMKPQMTKLLRDYIRDLKDAVTRY